MHCFGYVRIHTAIGRSLAVVWKAAVRGQRAMITYNTKINASSIVIERTTQPKEKVANDKLVFGRTFSDHMLEMDWDKENGWHAPHIHRYSHLSLSPAASVLHYGTECFEGMKAYKDSSGRVRLFRPDMNMARLNSSMARLSMPSACGEQFLECIKELLRVDADWVPAQEGYSIYIRPTAIGTSPFLGVQASEHVKLYVIMCPVGPYYKGGFKPIKLFADTENTRAWPGGVGNVKVGGNYGAALQPAQIAAERHGCSQILWLFGPDHQVTEVGAMNIFFVLKNKSGDGIELVTAPLDRGDILPGVTRASILDIARGRMSPGIDDRLVDLKVSERWLPMAEILEAEQEGRLLEAFGAGTAVVISPVSSILYKEHEIKLPLHGVDAGPIAQFMWKALYHIQYGKTAQPHPWSVVI